MNSFSSDPIAAHGWETSKSHFCGERKEAARPIAAWRAIGRIAPWLRDATAAAAVAEPSASSAAEWLLDNGYQVQRAMQYVQGDMPPGFYRRLRPLTCGASAGEPRILALAHDVLDATHFQLSREAVLAYLDGYQTVGALDVAELWALPAMLRIACLERLVSGFAEIFPGVEPPFPVSASCCHYIGSYEPVECVARAIANLGVVSNIIWTDIFDASSLVERTLGKDPAAIYRDMDFETRDACRRSIERLAGLSATEEVAVAEAVLAVAGRHDSLPHRHAGYWLIGGGVVEMEQLLGVAEPLARRLGRRLMRHPGGVYSVALFLCGLAGLVAPAAYLALQGASGWHWWVGITLSALPATVLSVTVVNWLVTLTVVPRRLPKLDFSDGIASAWPTLVAVPVIVGSVEEVPKLLARLEAHKLANPGARGYVLLSDPLDAPEERIDGDAAVEDALVQGIEELNRRQGRGFCLLHRARRHNPAQDCWMAWERKRGKIEEFNHFLLTGERAAFAIAAGSIDRLAGAKLVVTADADTRLPPGSVARLAGTMAHPLNRPTFDDTGRVIAGYTVLQPRVEIAPHGSDSLFARLFGGDTAIDIYSRAVSDVYQDLIGTGNYVGKGIYDIAGFARSLEGRIPENQLLSHDLWEGLHGRAGLASDIIVYESFPESYGEYARRWHRWVRGDWQLLPWLFPHVPGPGGTRLRNRLSLFDRLRIWDNMRRSLIPPAVLLLLIAGWFVLPGGPVFWTLLALLVPGGWLFTDLVTGLARGRRRGVLTGALRRAAEQMARWVLQIVFLLSDSVTAIHAIGVTLLRMRQGRRLLEWTSAAHISHHFAGTSARISQWRETWASPLLALVILGFLAIDGGALVAAAPLIGLWVAAPEIAWWTARPRRFKVDPLDAGDRAFLRKLARRSWFFFEKFAGPEDHWLPPDNHQEGPVEATAHRTSPTNIGMMALSALAAWRFGHIGSADFAERMHSMLDTLDRLGRWNGHILNWYDTRSLAPLEPRYVSTVDSGNLAVSMVTLAEGCRRIARAPPLPAWRWRGLDDCLQLLADTLAESGLPARHEGRVRALAMRLEYLGKDARRWPALVEDAAKEIRALRGDLAEALTDIDAVEAASLQQVMDWLERSDHHLRDCQRELDRLLPWLTLAGSTPPDCIDHMEALFDQLPIDAALSRGANLARTIDQIRDDRSSAGSADASGQWLAALDKSVSKALARWTRLERALEHIAKRAERLAETMDFRPLYDPHRKLFHIGYDVTAQRIDPHFYDLLASEARLASYFAIAKRDVPPEHWFHLGRPIARYGRELALISWNGSMFEYLMPPLFLRSDPTTLLGKSEASAVAIQQRYGKRRGIPWGISESGFASFGSDGTWRYRAFGVPKLGLRRGLAEDLVIAPYASALALALRPREAVANLRQLAENGASGRFGFHEALDFTPERMGGTAAPIPIRSYMAHHHGMTIAAIANALHEDILVKWFHADPRMGTVDLLLNERIPWELPPVLERIERVAAEPNERTGQVRPLPWEPAHGAEPATHLLGNGRLSLRIATDGCSDLSWKDHLLTRPVGADRDAGQFIYLRDKESGQIWSPAPVPLGGADERHVIFHPHKVEYRCRAGAISTLLDVLVSPSEDVEVRRLRLVNDSSESRVIEFASHAEIALAGSAEWSRHPAFARLFVEAEVHAEPDGLLFARRPREPGATGPAMMQRLVSPGDAVRMTGKQVARGRSRGRLGSAAEFPLFAAAGETPLRFPLDSTAAFSAEISVPPHGEVELALVTVAAPLREEALELARRYGSLAALDWAERDAADHVLQDLRAVGLAADRLHDAERLFSALAGPAAPRPPLPGDAARADLWTLGISGDLPILLMTLGEEFDAGALRFALAAHRLWRWRGARIDLALLFPGFPGYVEPLRERIVAILREHGDDEHIDARGGIHMVGSERKNERRIVALHKAAAAQISDGGGSIEAQLRVNAASGLLSPAFVPSGRETRGEGARREAMPDTELSFANGFGGFTAEGDYRIDLPAGGATPAPWANVLANPHFGSIVTEAGLGFTFAGNAGENRLTPWHNDPLLDPPGEVVYLRDEESGEIWSTTPLPAGRASDSRIEHGLGETRWSKRAMGLDQQLWCFVAPEDPVKIIRLRLTDRSTKKRRITATCFVDWLLGANVGEPAPFRKSWYRPDLSAILGQNRWQSDFQDRIAFLASSGAPHSLTTSRADFLGTPPDWRAPQGLKAWGLGDRSDNEGADAAAALQLHLDIPAGGSVEIAFLLGEVEQVDQVADLLARWRVRGNIESERTRVAKIWEARCAAIEVKTPDRAFDLMVNRWLPYQAMSSRLFARAGYYQASGAFGFRDQLQDVLALLPSCPKLAREQILRAAAHQFEAGDVLHWWHPPTDKGVRTRCSDDLLWLPFAVAQYVLVTGDRQILDERLPFLEADELRLDEHDRFSAFPRGAEANLFEHCLRAFDRAYRLGSHDLPLIGDGDWNDGMNRVGAGGAGESVWLAWFLAATIRDFASMCESMCEASQHDEFAARWLPRRTQLMAAIERHGWDGDWYLRAFDDLGRPWGSHINDECQIDSLAQSWAVIAGGDATRARPAVAAACARLVRADDSIARLLDPPFDKTPRDPGYIKAYPPGVRENGGQYSHAAAWLGIASALLGDGAGAKRIFDRINPVLHSATSDRAAAYAIEPYVVAGDIAGGAEHEGRGGWSWYTGAAAWSWQLATRYILGIRFEGGKVAVEPCLPPDWPGFTAILRGKGEVHLEVKRGKTRHFRIDGRQCPPALLAFPGEGAVTRVELQLAPTSSNDGPPA